MAGRRHQDILATDIEWRNGSRDGIKYARFEVNPDKKDAPSVVMTKFQPDVVVAPHTHGCNYLEYILEGELTLGKVTYRQGDVRMVKGGVGYGPLTMGKDGCTVLIVFEDGSRSSQQVLSRKVS